MKYLFVFFSFIFGLIALALTVGYFEMILGIITPTEIPIAIEATSEYLDIKAQLIGQDVFTLVVIIICFIMCSFFGSLYHRRNLRKKDTFDTNRIKGPFVLYLRSFYDDKLTQKRISFINDIRSEEEVLVSVMSDIAPVYAIGDPKDKKVPLGASRIYVDDEHWKSTVIDMMNRASVVVLRLGKTDSFWWEVETAVKNISLDKILFIVPQSKTFDNVAILYKILTEHNVGIQELNISIEKKNQGSISSFLYFTQNGQAVINEVKIPRLMRICVSYEDVLRNTLKEFRSKYGLKTNHIRTIKWARLSEILIIIWLVFVGTSRLFSDLVSLKYQMPYEFVEKCVENVGFVEKYSNEVNGTNLIWGIIEARKGAVALKDEDYKSLFLIEAHTLQLMRYDEFDQLNAAPKNMLLMVKKYVPDSYDDYVKILSEAAIIGIQYPNEVKELFNQYKSNIESLPQWVLDLVDSEDGDLDFVLKFNNEIIDHMDNADIVFILKTLYCLGSDDAM